MKKDLIEVRADEFEKLKKEAQEDEEVAKYFNASFGGFKNENV